MHVINNLRREGAQVVVRNLVVGASEFRSVVYSRTPGGALRQELTDAGIPVYGPQHYLGLGRTMTSAKLLVECARREGCTLVHAHLGDSAVLGWVAARRLGLPLVITHHGHGILPAAGALGSAIFSVLVRYAVRAAALNIAVSESVAVALAAATGIDQAAIAVVPNGVPVGASLPRARPVRKPPRIVTVGRLLALKGHEQLLAAAGPLACRLGGLQVRIVGDGPLEARFCERIDELGIAPLVQMTGAVDDVRAELDWADIYVSTSHHEGIPVSVLEAMAAGVAVIASDVPGNRDVVKHETSGLTYPLGDTGALCDAVVRMLTEPGLADRCRRTARSRIIHGFGLDAMRQRYVDLYQAVLEQAGTPAQPQK